MLLSFWRCCIFARVTVFCVIDVVSLLGIPSYYHIQSLVVVVVVVVVDAVVFVVVLVVLLVFVLRFRPPKQQHAGGILPHLL